MTNVLKRWFKLFMIDTICPLCSGIDVAFYHQDRLRKYYQCSHCFLVFVLSDSILSDDVEKSRYDFHQNSPEDEGYRRFLSRMFMPMNQRLTRGSLGLDFGSGPGPTLHLMFEEAGHQMQIYDKFYADDDMVFGKQYDFITATEVAEHLQYPMVEISRLWACLKKGGYLGIMTKMVVDKSAFSDWHYKNDDTHICFFSVDTFNWLALHLNAELDFIHKDVIIYRKL